MQNSAARIATLVVTVDIRQENEDSSLVTGLLETLRRHRAGALWALEFLRPPAIVDRIRGTWISHEFGVLATRDWAGPQATRTAFGNDLSARMTCASRTGVAPSAFALHDVDPPEHFDLLVKHQIPVLRLRTDTASGTTDSLQPRLARFGIWQSEPTIVVPAQSRWSLPWTARRLLQQASDRSQTLHVAVNGELLAKNPSAGLAALDYLLKLANTRRDRGELQLVPLSQLLRIYAPRREQIVSRSVLRAA